jgi:hypothetical protein
MPDRPAIGMNESGGLYELNEALHVLGRSTSGARPADIAQVEAFWCAVGMDFSSGGYVLRLHDGRRAYLDVWIERERDEGTPPKVEIELDALAAGQRYPHFPSAADPVGGWRDDVQPLNDFLHRTWRS